MAVTVCFFISLSPQAGSEFGGYCNGVAKKVQSVTDVE
jgi:hypothetical protein